MARYQVDSSEGAGERAFCGQAIVTYSTGSSSLETSFSRIKILTSTQASKWLEALKETVCHTTRK